MNRRKFEIEAAANFLADNPNCTIEEQLISLEADCDDRSLGVPDNVILWEPFEGSEVGEVLSNIYHLADQFEKFYNLGKNE